MLMLALGSGDVRYKVVWHRTAPSWLAFSAVAIPDTFRMRMHDNINSILTLVSDYFMSEPFVTLDSVTRSIFIYLARL